MLRGRPRGPHPDRAARRRRPVRGPARARRSPPTASSRRAPRRSTPACSPASRCRSRSARATRSSAPPSTPAAGWSSGPPGSARTPSSPRWPAWSSEAQTGKAAGAAAGRPGLGGVRAGRHRAGRRPRSASGSAPARSATRGVHRRGRGADHRLPVRARPGHADRAAGRHRPRRPARHPDQGPGGAGVHPPGRHRRAGQDRHRHHRPDGARRRRDRRRRRPRTELLRLAGALEARLRAPDRPRRSPRRPRERVGDLPPGDRLRQPRGPRRAGRRRRPRVLVGPARGCWPTRGITLPPDARRRAVDAAEAPGRTAVAAGWDGAVRGVLVVADTVKPTSAAGGRRAARARPDARSCSPATTRRPPARSPPRSASTDDGDRRGAARPTRSTWSSGCRPRAGWWRWSATASTTPPRSPRPTSGWPWAPAPTWPSRPSDLTLVRGDLRAAADAIRLSRRTLRTIKGNLFWAFAYNVAALPLAAAGPAQPDDRRRRDGALSSVFVVTNSLRLRTVPAVGSADGAGHRHRNRVSTQVRRWLLCLDADGVARGLRPVEPKPARPGKLLGVTLRARRQTRRPPRRRRRAVVGHLRGGRVDVDAPGLRGLDTGVEEPPSRRAGRRVSFGGARRPWRDEKQKEIRYSSWLRPPALPGPPSGSTVRSVR